MTDLGDIAHPEHGDLTADETLAGMDARVLAHAPPRMAVVGSAQRPSAGIE